MWLGGTDKYSIYYNDDKFTVYDKRMNNHLPFVIQGDDAIEFKERINTIPIVLDDDIVDAAIDELCDQMKEISLTRKES